MTNKEKFKKTYGVEVSEYSPTDPWWDKEYNPRWQKRCKDCIYLSDKQYHKRFLCNCPDKEFKNKDLFYKYKGGYACEHFKERGDNYEQSK